MVIPVGIFFASAVWMLYARLFINDTSPAISQAAQQQAVGSIPVRSALPPAVSNPIPNIGREQVRTNELVPRPSVTENTTRLLDNE